MSCSSLSRSGSPVPGARARGGTATPTTRYRPAAHPCAAGGDALRSSLPPFFWQLGFDRADVLAGARETQPAYAPLVGDQRPPCGQLVVGLGDRTAVAARVHARARYRRGTAPPRNVAA